MPEILSGEAAMEFIAEHSIATVEAFIDALPDLYKKHFLLVFRSEALDVEHVSGEHPRVVSWGADARFILSWSTDPEATHHESVEFLERHETGWTPGVIDFSADQVVRTSPSECGTCHGTVGKPLFGTVYAWEGTEEPDGTGEYTEDSPHVKALRNAIQSTDPRLEPLHFSEVTPYLRRYLNFAPGVLSATVVREFHSQLAIRQGEVVFRNLMDMDRRGEIDFGEDIFCDDSLGAFDPVFRQRSHFRDYHPMVRAHDLAPVHGTFNSWRGHGGNYGDVRRGDFEGVSNTLFLYRLLRTDDRIKELYRSTPSKEFFFKPNRNGLTQFDFRGNNYEYGRATSEDELMSSYNLHFVYRGRAALDARLGSVGMPAASSGVVLRYHPIQARKEVCRILRQGAPPKKFWAADSFAVEAAEEAVFHVVLGPENDAPATVYFSTEDVTATDGEDYRGVAGSLTFLTGDRERRLAVPLVHDSLEERTESFRLTLTDADGVVLDTATGTVHQSGATAAAVAFLEREYTVAGGASVEVAARIRGRGAAGGVEVPLVAYERLSRSPDNAGVPDKLVFPRDGGTTGFTFSAAEGSVTGEGEDLEVRFGTLPEGVAVAGPTAAMVKLKVGSFDGRSRVANSAPEADAGGGGTFLTGEAVTLDGSGSTDEDGTIVRHVWRQSEGEPVPLENAGPGRVRFVAPATPRALEFVLTVEDDGGATATDTVSVLVERNSGAPTIRSPAAFTVTEGVVAVATLAAEDDRTSSDDLVWSIPEGGAGGVDRGMFRITSAGALRFVSAKDYEAPDDADGDGVYRVAVRVSDGRFSRSEAITVALANRNEPPTAEAGDDLTGVREGAAVTLRGQGEDPDAGDSLSYSWRQIGGPSVALASPASPSTTFQAPDGLSATVTLTFRLRVTDARGLYGEDRVTVSVRSGTAGEDDVGGGGGGSGGGGSGGGGSGGGGGDSSDEDDDSGGDTDSSGGAVPAGPPRASIALEAECSAELCRARTGVPVRFEDAGTGGVRRRVWDFGDGSTSRSRSTEHAWTEPGFYEVGLWVSDGREESSDSRMFLVEAASPAGSCEADAETRCLRDSRYAVRVRWFGADGGSGAGTVIHAGTNSSGLFSFFDRRNWEVVLKVLDGCVQNGRVWVLGASTTDLGYVISVRDTVTGEEREYRNEPGRSAPAIVDARAFPDGCRE